MDNLDTQFSCKEPAYITVKIQVKETSNLTIVKIYSYSLISQLTSEKRYIYFKVL
jgi:hypothetical protein